MEKKMNWGKCIIGILISFIFYLFVSDIILSLLLPATIMGNIYLAYGIKSFICAIFFIIVVIAFGQKDRIGFTFKSFGKGFIVGATMTAVSVVAFVVSLIWGFRDYGGPRLDTASIIIYVVALFFGAGICEEFLTRAITMNFLRSALGNTKKGTVLAIILSSLPFGLLHFINLSNGDVIGTLGQVLYAIGFGVLLGAMYVRSKNIWANVVIHFIFDLSLLMYGVIFRGQAFTIAELLGNSHVLLKSFGLFALTTAIGLYLLKGNYNEELGEKN
ncbi:CPBP family intramembrane glutamic endopeptidase [Butyrivibrio sp. INlla21]|uniref:CPBP family intramembrane glutamic endopeptidase n=1 Tax=Butyrivibrio sp. INlla21 TaxID=1520811 RepID=UPI0008E7837F|nr:type II CAAX endopeptidase family protein [Butyrivibrio sp. INlla21]SFV01532.1 CAAX protease self-immunity [Butyrivibrio sp. INlla21]